MTRAQTATPAGVDIKHWLSRAEAHREQDGGYVHESLAVEMACSLGWWRAQRIADQVGTVADSTLAEDAPGAVPRHLGLAWSPLPTERQQAKDAAALADCLGWAQSVLFAAWFRRLENYRMIRDDFPGDLTNRELWKAS